MATAERMPNGQYYVKKKFRGASNTSGNLFIFRAYASGKYRQAISIQNINVPPELFKKKFMIKLEILK